MKIVVIWCSNTRNKPNKYIMRLPTLYLNTTLDTQSNHQQNYPKKRQKGYSSTRPSSRPLSPFLGYNRVFIWIWNEKFICYKSLGIS